ncbi:hypothetical protein [Lysobacter panacisoli]|uniref:Cupin domain-containing protein n=1 Tax=Lysobacter panacisoli TaxID=1255263 RepID=A0ABP9LCF7_9GAMM|nr:hypothetical protein [Lysobacter panacisoli]
MDCTDAVTFYDVTLDLTPAREEIAPVHVIGPAPTREKIFQLQDLLLQFPQVENEPEHYFADGIYGRALPIKAGSIIVGKIHRHEHIVMLIKGSVTVNTDRGMETITAPHIWVAAPGAKRAFYAHEDSLLFTAHTNPNNERDLEVIEAHVIEPEGLLTHAPEVSEFTDELQGMFV